MKYGPMPLASVLCAGVGVEFGAAAHNAFHLEDCRNIAPSDGIRYVHPQDLLDYRKYVDHGRAMGEGLANVDLIGDMENIPVDDGSVNYAISSHVIEHEPNPIRAFKAIGAKLKDDGIAFFVFPKRNQASINGNDGIRALTTLEEFVRFYLDSRTVLTADMDYRAHYCVYSLQSFLGLVCWCNRNLGLGWVVEAIEETDSKVGNGHTAAFRKSVALAELGAKVRAEDAVQDAFALTTGLETLDAERVEQAITLLRIALSLDFAQPEALFLLGRLLHARGHGMQSREFMQQALILRPEHEPYRRVYYETHGTLYCNPLV